MKDFYYLLIGRMKNIEQWHDKLTRKISAPTMKLSMPVVALITFSVILSAALNYHVRQSQYDIWADNKDIFFHDDSIPLFTTTDAPYFLGLAQAIKRQDNFQSFNAKRLYPRNKTVFEKVPPSNSLRDAPLLSVILSFLAEDGRPKSLLEAGHSFILISAVLTSLMVVFAFGVAGYWLEGAIASAGGGLSFAYLVRSGAGRIDTDQLNLGFMYLMIGLVILASRARSLASALLLAAIAGAAMWIFDWWYSKPIFGWFFMLSMIWLSFVIHKDIKRTLLQSLVFLILSGLLQKGLGIGDNYLIETVNFGNLIFPNSFDTITELKIVPLAEMLDRMTGSLVVGLFALAGLAVWALRNPALAIVFAPVAGFALLNFFIGSRAIFYSTPMFWFGFSWAILFLARWGANHYAAGHKFRNHVQVLSVWIASSIGFSTVWALSPTSYLSMPSFPRPVVAGLAHLDAVDKRPESVVATWWDYGYASIFLNNMNVLHDGGGQTSPVTHYTAKALLASQQSETVGIFKFLVNEGVDGIAKRSQSKERILEGFKLAQDIDLKEDVFLVLTRQMSEWMGSISQLGMWDESTGQPIKFSPAASNGIMDYTDYACKQTAVASQILCDSDTVDLSNGKVNGRPVFKAAAQTENGRLTGFVNFENPDAHYILQIVKDKGQPVYVKVMSDRLFASTFHSLFYLATFEDNLFELVYDGYPQIRIYKLKNNR